MHCERLFIPLSGSSIPTIAIIPKKFTTSCIVIHGIGGNKEEQMGLGYKIAHMGINTVVIDLRGHGENKSIFDGSILQDVNELVELLRKQGKVISIGHSLGGRLSLISGADIKIGISPVLGVSYSEQTQTMIASLRNYRVRELKSTSVFQLLYELPTITGTLEENSFIVYGSRDVPEVIQCCRELTPVHGNIVEIEKALHSDIFCVEDTFKSIKDFITKATV